MTENHMTVTPLDLADTQPSPGLTVRRGHPQGAQLFVLGTRVGFYKTERGLTNAINRHRADALLGAYQGVVRVIGAGFHPDTAGANYTGNLPQWCTPEYIDWVNEEVVAAGLNPYAIALDLLAEPMDKWIEYLEGLTWSELDDIIQGRVKPGTSQEENILIWNLAIDIERDMR